MKQRAMLNSFLSASLVLAMQAAHADHLVQCPSVETLNTYSFGAALPYAYQQSNQSLQVISVVIDPTSAGKVGLVIYPVPVALTGDPEIATIDVVSQLQLETAAPVSYRLAAGMNVPMCVYTLPGKQNVTALLFSQEHESDDNQPLDLKSIQKKPSKREQAMKFLKFVNKY